VTFLRGDTALRLASLALAASLWFAIAGKQTAERGVPVPVELRNVPRDLELTGDTLNTVDVRVRASPGLINSLDASTIRATIDLTGAEEGERIVQLAPDQIQAPQGFRVVKITPSLLTLKLERTVRKAIPVRPRVIGRPGPGYELAEITSAPAEVRVAGPRSRVQEIESAFTEPVSVAGAETTVDQLVNVGLEDPFLRLEGGHSVRVTAVVRETRETRRFEGLRVEARGRSARLSPSRVSVSVAGPASQVRGLGAADVQPYVALPREGAVPARLPVSVEIGPGRAGVSVLETRPAEVSVRVLGGKSRP
jgi:YbbR domain-containing protein